MFDIYSMAVFKEIIQIHFQRGTLKPGSAAPQQNSLSITHESPMSHNSMQAHTHTHTHTLYMWKILVSFWPRSTFDTGTEEPV